MTHGRLDTGVASCASWPSRQVQGVQNSFTIDVVDYEPVLGPAGLAAYRSQLAGIADGLGLEPSDEQEAGSFRARLADPGGWQRTA
jgi:hypothetical protein